MKKFVREQGLTLFFGAAFFLTLLAQALAGHAEYNSQLVLAGLHPITLVRYVTSASFAADVTENWQSEYLQFFLYIIATVWLVQKGSTESKEPDDAGGESDKDQLVGKHAKPDSPSWAKDRGFRGMVYSNSLGTLMGVIFILCWSVQSVAGWSAYNDERLRDVEAPVSWLGYLQQPDFWNRTFQNWQSELLAVASMVALSIYLRQRGSPESKLVGSPHEETGSQG